MASAPGSEQSAIPPPNKLASARARLQEGTPVKFESGDPAADRTVQAAWVIAALLDGKAIDLKGAVIEGSLLLRYADVSGPSCALKIANWLTVVTVLMRDSGGT